jgi:hypothetical protein
MRLHGGTATVLSEHGMTAGFDDGFRGELRLATRSFRVEPTVALHNAISALGR